MIYSCLVNVSPLSELLLELAQMLSIIGVMCEKCETSHTVVLYGATGGRLMVM